MKTDEIVKLTPQRVASLVRARQAADEEEGYEGSEKRDDIRWPFPGAVELWPDDGDGRERWYATCRNLSFYGLGMLTEQPFEPGTHVELACHFPEASFYGQAVIRHCTETPHGFLVGVEFDYAGR